MSAITSRVAELTNRIGESLYSVASDIDIAARRNHCTPNIPDLGVDHEFASSTC